MGAIQNVHGGACASISIAYPPESPVTDRRTPVDSHDEHNALANGDGDGR